MRYLFVLGRNIKLSIAEVLNYLERVDNKSKKYIQRNNAILVDVDKKLEDKAIDKLGGVIAIGEVIENMDNALLYRGTKNNMNYVIWNFSDDIDRFEDYLKKRFREERLKATKKPFNFILNQLNEEFFSPVRMYHSKIIDEQYFAFNDIFGRIIQTCDYAELEKRDMEKPVRRSKLSISPRLSKIMINLSRVKKGKLIDPFCGIGGVLFEALLQGIEVIGVDIDQEAINGAKRNIEWLKFPKNKYQLIASDSRRVKIEDCEVIATEPNLGELKKKLPSNDEINERFTKFENLMVSVLNNLKNSVSGRIVFTSPYIRDRNCNIDYICSKTWRGF